MRARSSGLPAGRPSRRRVLAAATVLALAAAADGSARPADAQDASGRATRIFVPFSPGAAVDIVARMLASSLADHWGKPVIVENRPGGRTLIAAELVARSEPNGNTLLFCLDDTFTLVPHLTKTREFDPNKELVAVNMVGTISMVLALNPSVPADSVPKFIEHARANPAAVNYGSSGTGSANQLAMEMFKSLAKVEIAHVPFQGLAPVLTALVAGDIQVAVLGYGSSRGMIESGRIRPIAIASPQRMPTLPNVPTTAELGYPKVDSTSRLVLAAPAKLAPAALDKLSDDISRVLSAPAMRKQIETRDINVTNMGPKPLASEMARISVLNAEAVRIAGAQAN